MYRRVYCTVYVQEGILYWLRTGGYTVLFTYGRVYCTGYVREGILYCLSSVFINAMNPGLVTVLRGILSLAMNFFFETRIVAHHRCAGPLRD